jgi:hypothetical protein
MNKFDFDFGTITGIFILSRANTGSRITIPVLSVQRTLWQHMYMEIVRDYPLWSVDWKVCENSYVESVCSSQQF